MPTARWIHAPSNRSYNTDFPATRPKVPGKDDVTGEPLTKRPDDTAVSPLSPPPSLPAYSLPPRTIARCSQLIRTRFRRPPLHSQEIFQKRLDAFHDENNPLLEHYRGVKVALGPDGREVPVLVTLAGKTSDEIWPQLVKVVEERFPHLRKAEGK